MLCESLVSSSKLTQHSHIFLPCRVLCSTQHTLQGRNMCEWVVLNRSGCNLTLRVRALINTDTYTRKRTNTHTNSHTHTHVECMLYSRRWMRRHQFALDFLTYHFIYCSTPILLKGKLPTGPTCQYQGAIRFFNFSSTKQGLKSKYQ